MRKIDLSKYLVCILFIFFICGIVTGKFFNNFYFFLIFSFSCLVLEYYFYKCKNFFVSNIFIVFLFLFLGGLWEVSTIKNLDRILNKDNIYSLKVISLPKREASRNTFRAQILQAGTIFPKIKVRVIDYTRDMEYLHSYQVKAKLSKRKYKGKFFYSLWVKSKDSPIKFRSNFWGRLIINTNKYVFGVFEKNSSLRAQRFLSAAFLGRKELLKGEKDIFANAGVSHLLAISGLHLGLTSLILFFSLRFFNIGFRACLVVSLGFLYFYTFLTGSSLSTLRAVIMYSVFVISFFMRRKSNNLNSLSLAGFIILLINPGNIFEIGFQLSFVSVFFIILGYKFFNVTQINNFFLNYLKQIFFCSLFVTVGITPIVSYYFDKIYVLNIFYNVILIPIFTFILGVNFILILFSPLRFIAKSLGEVLSVSIGAFIELTRALGSIKYSFVYYHFSLFIVFLYYLLLVVSLYFFYARKKKRFHLISLGK